MSVPLRKKLCLTINHHALQYRKVAVPKIAYEALKTALGRELSENEFNRSYHRGIQRAWTHNPYTEDMRAVELKDNTAASIYRPFIANESELRKLAANLVRDMDGSAPAEAKLFPDVLPFFEGIKTAAWPWEETVIFLAEFHHRGFKGPHRNGHVLSELGLNISGQDERKTLDSKLAPVDLIIPFGKEFRIFDSIAWNLRSMRPDDHSEFNHLFVTAAAPWRYGASVTPPGGDADVGSKLGYRSGKAVSSGFPLVTIDRYSTEVGKEDRTEGITFEDVESVDVIPKLGNVQKLADLVMIKELSALEEWEPGHSDRTKAIWKDGHGPPRRSIEWPLCPLREDKGSGFLVAKEQGIPKYRLIR